MKPPESDKHYITEYYIRKWFRVKWLSNWVRLWKRDNSIDCIIIYKWTVREFIENSDKFINNLLEKWWK